MYSIDGSATSRSRESLSPRGLLLGARVSPIRYLPFGAGPRACIGGAYALLACQIVLTVVLRDVRLVRQWTQPIAADPLMTLRPSGPLPVAVDWSTNECDHACTR